MHHELQPLLNSVSRRSLLKAGAVGGAGLAAALLPGLAPAKTGTTAPTAARAHTRGFVGVRRGHFALEGRRYSVAGTNNYYLHYKSHGRVDDVLDDAVAMGLNTIRTWGWLDGPASDGSRCNRSRTSTPRRRTSGSTTPWPRPAAAASGWSPR